MILAEPPSTRYDLRFALGDIPVRVHPLFWLISLFMVARQDVRWQDAFIWILVVFVAILVHELGHVVAFRRFGRRARVVLYSFGGLAIPDLDYDPRPLRTRAMVLTALAGPTAGFLLALSYFVMIKVLGFGFDGEFIHTPGRRMPDLLWELTDDVFWVNVIWGLVNLLPIYPLDGGLVARELLTARTDSGIRTSLILSSIAAFAVTAAGLFSGQIMLAMMFGYLGVINIRELQELRGWTPGRDQPW